MQVWASVNEADIGNIRPGQPVTFTVDAYPGQTFRGQVSKVRLNAAMTQNVVTYTVEITTDNPDGKLLPYLTANVRFEVAHRENVLIVPNAALRWTPLPELVAPDAREALQADGGRGPGRGGAMGGGDRRRGTTRPESGQAAGMRPGTVWVADGRFVRPVVVQAGLSDGTMTEIQSADLAENAEVIVAQVEESTGAPGASASPFTPQLMRRRASSSQ